MSIFFTRRKINGGDASMHSYQTSKAQSSSYMPQNPQFSSQTSGIATPSIEETRSIYNKEWIKWLREIHTRHSQSGNLKAVSDVTIQDIASYILEDETCTRMRHFILHADLEKYESFRIIAYILIQLLDEHCYAFESYYKKMEEGVKPPREANGVLNYVIRKTPNPFRKKTNMKERIYKQSGEAGTTSQEKLPGLVDLLNDIDMSRDWFPTGFEAGVDMIEKSLFIGLKCISERIGMEIIINRNIELLNQYPLMTGLISAGFPFILNLLKSTMYTYSLEEIQSFYDILKENPTFKESGRNHTLTWTIGWTKEYSLSHEDIDALIKLLEKRIINIKSINNEWFTDFLPFILNVYDLWESIKNLSSETFKSSIDTFKNRVKETLRNDKRFEKVDNGVLNSWVETNATETDGVLGIESEKVEELLIGVLGKEKLDFMGHLKSTTFTKLFDIAYWQRTYNIVFTNNENVTITTTEGLNERIELISKSIDQAEKSYFGFIDSPPVNVLALAEGGTMVTTAVAKTAQSSVWPEALGSSFVSRWLGYTQLDSLLSSRFFMGVSYNCHLVMETILGDKYKIGLGGNTIRGSYTNRVPYSLGFLYKSSKEFSTAFINISILGVVNSVKWIAESGIGLALIAEKAVNYRDRIATIHNEQVIRDAASLLEKIKVDKDAAELETIKRCTIEGAKLATSIINSAFFLRNHVFKTTT